MTNEIKDCIIMLPFIFQIVLGLSHC